MNVQDHLVGYPIDFNLEMAVEADERFLPAVMHMERSLIALARMDFRPRFLRGSPCTR